MPSTYTTAGYDPYNLVFSFYTPGSPARILQHAEDVFLMGDLTIKFNKPVYYELEAPPSSMVGSMVLGKLTTNPLYHLITGDQPNPTISTYNLPPLGPTDSVTRVLTNGSPSTQYTYTRAGSEVWEIPDISNTWSPVATLGNAGTSDWKGLAVRRNPTKERFYFTQATITGGGSGIIEQRWPNALPSEAAPPVVVYPGTDLVPIGITPKGCELYTSRKKAQGGIEVVVLER
ncbi:hypothetical protein [Polyangium mundeleinium]|uniref:Uncharacterized protein n=1 Tax=Polyangium mundeleinium TaxID=2995306 RepID=A0ABT5EN96_9BACT|nr:hypothetical protein [Polyangium mundeleinium]MDC0743312.1 hypothetical protein [Polyangium mundeleinium]